MTSELKEKLQTVQAAQAVDRPSQSSVLSLLQDGRIKVQLARALPRAITADRFMRIVLTEVRQNPRLLECTPESFMACVMDAAQLGLEPGPLGHAYLVPFRDSKKRTTECSLILGYKGLIDLARRSGEITSIKARAVHEHDQFRYSEGLQDELVHEPNLDGDRGQAVRFYAVALFKNGGHAFRVMSRAEVDKIRARSRAKDDGPWVSDYETMACKTVIRQLANRGELPLTIEAAEAISTDEAREFGLQPPATLDLNLADLPAAGETPSGSTAAETTDTPIDGKLGLGADGSGLSTGSATS